MSFDALTIVGICAAILSGGFLIALVARNDGVRQQIIPLSSNDQPAGRDPSA